MLVFCVLVSSCAQPTVAEEVPPIPVRLARVAPAPTRCGFSATGMVRADRRVELAFNVSGYVTSVARRGDRHVEVGDQVRRGELLATVRASDYDVRSSERASIVAQAVANRSQAVLDEARAARLLESEAISRAEYDTTSNRLEAARAAAEAAEAGRRQAEISLSDTRLAAPFDATVLARRVEQGSLVAAGTSGYVLGSLAKMRVDVAVPERVAARLAPGRDVPFRMASSAEPRVAHVLTVSPSADPVTRLVPVELVVDNKDGTLRDGRPAHVDFPDDCLQGDAVVPVESLVRAAGAAGSASVWVTSTERGRGRAERREVQVLGLVAADVIVRGDLKPDERVVTMGSTQVTESTDLEVVP